MKKIDVYQIASLAKLELTADEAERMEAEIRQFAQYALSLEKFTQDSFLAPCAEERTRADVSEENEIDISSFANGLTDDGYISVPLTVEAE